LAFHEDYLVVARRGHPAVTGSLDLAQYTRLGHVLVSPLPGGTLTGVVDNSLADAGVSRHVVMSVPYFFAALSTVARSDLIATVPAAWRKPMPMTSILRRCRRRY
jgi:hypothetical protein